MAESVAATTTEPPAPGRLAPLRHRNFRLLVTGTATSSLGNAITPVALAFAVLDLGGSASELGLVVAAYALTEVVTALFGGVLGDRVAAAADDRGVLGGVRGHAGAGGRSADRGLGDVPTLAVLGGRERLPGRAQPALVLGDDPGHRAARAARRRRLPAGAHPDQRPGRRLRARRRAGRGGRIRLGDRCRRGHLRDRGRLLRPARGTARAGEGPRASMLADLGDGLREVLRHTWLCPADRAGAALPPVLRRRAGRARTDRGRGRVRPIVVGSGAGRADGRLRGRRVDLPALAAAPVLVRRDHPALADRGVPAGDGAEPTTVAPVLVGAFLHGFGLQIFDVNWQLSIQQNIPEDKLARVYSFDLVGSFVARPARPRARRAGRRGGRLRAVAGRRRRGDGRSALLSLFSRDVRRWNGAPDPGPRRGSMPGMNSRSGLVAAAASAVLILTAGSAPAIVPNGGEDDVVTGTAGADVLRGGRGYDRLVGRQGDDRLLGGPGQDRLEGGLGHDTLRGGPGADTLIPGRDHQVDRIVGGRGHDYAAAIRNDHVSMGSGFDVVLVARPQPGMVIDCGPGKDTVSFNEAPPLGLLVEGCEEVVVLG